LAQPSAIWLRQELPVHRNRMRVLAAFIFANLPFSLATTLDDLKIFQKYSAL
jgi:hypothetical protein